MRIWKRASICFSIPYFFGTMYYFHTYLTPNFVWDDDSIETDEIETKSNYTNIMINNGSVEVFSNTTNESVPKLLHLMNKFIFLHPGKSGGGTFKMRLKYLWRMEMLNCHPRPKKCFQHWNKRKASFITIRDPIDRFVSAFNWRSILLCNDDNVREKFKYLQDKDKVTFDPILHCKERQHETQVIFQKYQQNVSVLAEGICSNWSQTKNDLDFIGHIREGSLTEWFHGRKNWDRLIPIILEKDVDFKEQIDEGILWAQQRFQFETPSKFAMRHQSFLKRNLLNDSFIGKSVSIRKEHSSVRMNRNETPSLSKLGKACLAQFFVKDYLLIKEIRDFGCKSINCKMACQSILNRRYELFQNLSTNVLYRFH